MLGSQSKELDLRQTELARKIGVSQKLISRYECGTAHIPGSRRFEIAVALECSLIYLVTGKGTVDATPSEIREQERKYGTDQEMIMTKLELERLRRMA